MHLIDEAGKSVKHPSTDHIEQVVQDLDNGSFAILEKESGTYMQTLCVGEEYELEYQIGDVDQHFRSRDPVSREQVIRAMSQYSFGDDSWLDEINWERQDLSSGGSGKGCAGMLLFVLTTVALISSL